MTSQDIEALSALQAKPAEQLCLLVESYRAKRILIAEILAGDTKLKYCLTTF